MARRGSAVLLGLAVATLLAGCTDLDRAELSEFRLTGPYAFEFRATTNLSYPADSGGWAEGQRLRWLADHIDAYAVCPRGYMILSRRPVFQYSSPLGNPVDVIVYRGFCRS